MRVAILGAAGKLGRHLVQSAGAHGHEVTAAVRDPDGFRRSLAPDDGTSVRVAPFDALDSATLDAVLAGQDAVISAVGTVGDGQGFVEVFDRIVTGAERVLGDRRRVWMVAGAAILDVPHTQRIGLDLPFVPQIYQPHLANWRRLQRSQLDWALMCPGPMVMTGGAVAAAELAVSIDCLPYAVGGWARYAPPIALSLMMKRMLPMTKVPYRAVADVIMGRLEPGDAVSRHRVGVAWSTPARTGAPSGSAR